MAREVKLAEGLRVVECRQRHSKKIDREPTIGVQDVKTGLVAALWNETRTSKTGMVTKDTFSGISEVIDLDPAGTLVLGPVFTPRKLSRFDAATVHGLFNGLKIARES